MSSMSSSADVGAPVHNKKGRGENKGERGGVQRNSKGDGEGGGHEETPEWNGGFPTQKVQGHRYSG